MGLVEDNPLKEKGVAEDNPLREKGVVGRC
jgi:hypothetical protein